MADDELPKDYSSVYCEDSFKPPPVPPMRRTPNGSNTMMPIHNHKHHVSHNHQQSSKAIWSDGAKSHKRTSESTVDLRAVVAKLQNLPQENHAYAMYALNDHYSSFVKCRQGQKAAFKAYIQYSDEKDTYVVRVDRNTLRSVKDKLPKRGNYRYFFKQQDNTCEEVESDVSIVPFLEKDGFKQIYCQVFPF